MKSILLCYTLICASFLAFLSGVDWIRFDHAQNTTTLAVKRSLMSTMVDYVDEREFEAYEVFNTFTYYFKEIALKDYDYQLFLTGFMKEPLFMRVECVATPIQSHQNKIHVEDMMIEELREDE